MAQVIRKYLDGGSTETKLKPTIIKRNGSEYSYDDIEKNIWNNFNEQANYYLWDNSTKNAVREYLNYVLSGIKTGEVVLNNDGTIQVAPEWESDGTFNTTGHGLLKKDVTNDKRGASTLGTAYINALFDLGIINSYVKPEKKKINLNLKIIDEITKNYFSGSTSAMEEAWLRMTPEERTNIFKEALSSLQFDPEEYEIGNFNENREKLLLALDGELGNEAYNLYNKMGGTLLELILKGEAKSSSTENTGEDVPTIEQMRQSWRQEAILQGYYTDDAISKYIALKEEEYNKHQSSIDDVIAQKKNLDAVSDAVDTFGKVMKLSIDTSDSMYNSPSKTLSVLVSSDFKPDEYNFASGNDLKIYFLSLYNEFRKLVKSGFISLTNLYTGSNLGKSLLSAAVTLSQMGGAYVGEGGWYALDGSENMNDLTVIAFNPTTNQFKIMSIYKFNHYLPQLSKDFIQSYNLKHGLSIPDDFLTTINLPTTLLTPTLQQVTTQQPEGLLQVVLNRKGGILKALEGIAFLRNQLSANESSSSTGSLSNNDPFSNWDTIKRLLEELKINEEKLEAEGLHITVEELRQRKAKESKLLKSRDEKLFSETGTINGYDYARMASALLDVGALIASFEPGPGTALAGVLGVTSTLTDLGADIFDPSVTSGQVWTNLGINTAMTVAGMIPGGKSASIGRKVLKAAPHIITLLGASLAAGPFKQAIEKGNREGFSNLSREDWKAIYYGIKIATLGGSGGIRSYRNYLVGKRFMVSNGDNKIKIKTSTGREVELTDKLFTDLQGKTNQEATEYLRTAKKADGTPVLGENEGLSKSFWNTVTFGKFGKQFLTKTEEGTMRLKTPDEVALENNGRLPGNYVDQVMRFPHLLSKEHYDAVMKAAGVNLKTIERMVKWGNPYNIAKSVKRPAFFSKLFGNISKTGEVEYTSKSNPAYEKLIKSLPETEGLRFGTLKDITVERQTEISNLIQNNPNIKAYVKRDGSILLLDPGNLPKGRMFNLERFISLDTKVPLKDGSFISLADAYAQGKEISLSGVLKRHPSKYNPLSKGLYDKVSSKSVKEMLETLSNTGKAREPLLITLGDKEKSRITNLLKNYSDNQLGAYVNGKGEVRIDLLSKLKSRPGYNPKRVLSLSEKIKTESGSKTIKQLIKDGSSIRFIKNGGFVDRVINNYQIGGKILKFQPGGNVVGNINTNKDNYWYNDVFSRYADDLYNDLEAKKKSGDNDFNNMISDINEMLKYHLFLSSLYDPTKGAYFGTDNNVGKYQLGIINRYGYVNQKGISNAWDTGIYSPSSNRSYGTDRGKDGTYKADNVFGSLTNDRRILGRYGDFSDELLTSLNNRFKNLGLEMYLLDGPDPNNKSNNYYMLRRIQNLLDLSTSGLVSLTPLKLLEAIKTNNLTTTNEKDANGNAIYTTPDGKKVTLDLNGNPVTLSVGGEPNTKSPLLKIGEKALGALKQVNPADILMANRAIRDMDANRKMTEILKSMDVALSDPMHQYAAQFGDYNAKVTALLNAGKIMATMSKPFTSDAGTQLNAILEGATKAADSIAEGNLLDSKVLLSYRDVVQSVENNNRQWQVDNANSNREKFISFLNNKKLADMGLVGANTAVLDTLSSTIEGYLRNEHTLQDTAKIDAWKNDVAQRYGKMYLDKTRALQEAKIKAYDEWSAKEENKDKDYAQFEKEWIVNPFYKKTDLELRDIARQQTYELYHGLPQWYDYKFGMRRSGPEGYEPEVPAMANPGIVGPNYTRYKKGGSLSYEERQALKLTNEVNKNIRQAAKLTSQNINLEKKEHRKAMALVSLLSADLIKKAVGIIK